MLYILDRPLISNIKVIDNAKGCWIWFAIKSTTYIINRRTLFPTDSEKSVIILFAKITSFDIVFEFIDNEFSFTKSKS